MHRAGRREGPLGRLPKPDADDGAAGSGAPAGPMAFAGHAQRLGRQSHSVGASGYAHWR